MVESDSKEVFPIAIFLDTNILDALPENLHSGDLSGLIADAGSIGASVYISDVVAREWVKHRTDKFLKSLEAYQKAQNHMKKYFPDIPEFRITKDDFEGSVYRVLILRLKNCGCRLLGPPKATIASLTRRAVWEMPPFRGANRGFKDELVVLSMLKLRKRGWNYKTYVLVTMDNDFPATELQNRFALWSVNFERVNSLRDARKLLEAKLDETWKQKKSQLEAEIKEFISGYWETIAEAVVRRIEDEGLSMWTIYGYGEDDIPKNSLIKRIVKAIPMEIQYVDVGIEEEATHEIPITIGVHTKLSIEIEQSPFLDRALFEKLGTQGWKSDRDATQMSQFQTVDVGRQIHLYAIATRDQRGALAGLELVDMRPDIRRFMEEHNREKPTGK
jgi:hypothetical protein